jgi:hypothetical protein
MSTTSSVGRHDKKSFSKKLNVAKRIIADDSSMSSTSSAGRHFKKQSSKKLMVSMAKRYKWQVTGPYSPQS